MPVEAEIELAPQGGVGGEFLRGPLEHCLALVQDERVVGDVGDILEPVRGEDDCLTELALFLHEPAEFEAGRNVEAGCGLIEDEQRRVRQHRERQREALPHAAGKRVGPLPGVVAEPDPLHHLAGPVVGDALEVGVEHAGLADGEVAVERWLLRDVADKAASLLALPGDIDAVDQHLALELQEADDALQERGFACSIRADYGEHRALPQFERDPVKRGVRAVALARLTHG